MSRPRTSSTSEQAVFFWSWTLIPVSAPEESTWTRRPSRCSRKPEITGDPPCRWAIATVGEIAAADEIVDSRVSWRLHERHTLDEGQRRLSHMQCESTGVGPQLDLAFLQDHDPYAQGAGGHMGEHTWLAPLWPCGSDHRCTAHSNTSLMVIPPSSRTSGPGTGWSCSTLRKRRPPSSRPPTSRRSSSCAVPHHKSQLVKANAPSLCVRMKVEYTPSRRMNAAQPKAASMSARWRPMALWMRSVRRYLSGVRLRRRTETRGEVLRCMLDIQRLYKR